MQSVNEELLLHTCCASCTAHVIDTLSQTYRITAFFYNPNIQPESEYSKRLKDLEKLCEIKKIKLIVPQYDASAWFAQIRGLEDEPEGKHRCTMCFRIRLAKVAEAAHQKGIPNVTTTLTISPHKNARVINTIGTEAAKEYKIQFLEYDFKKKDGFRKSCELSRRYGFYRQQYCGCIFSKRMDAYHER